MANPFQLIDVFCDGDFSGNPLAVVADADALATEQMQRIANWLNLSETAFLLRATQSEADYRVRIFTVDRELPFAGHPTLGSCHAWLQGGGQPRGAEIVQQCDAGLVAIRQDADRLAFAAPPLTKTGPLNEAELAEVLEILQIERAAIVDAAWAANGPGWVAVMLPSAAAVLALEPLRSHPRIVDIGVVGPHLAGADIAFEIRAFFSAGPGAVVEDPVTGSLNASIAQWLYGTGRAQDAYVAAQGTRLGRRGRIYVDRDTGGRIWIGGATRTLFAGETGF